MDSSDNTRSIAARPARSRTRRLRRGLGALAVSGLLAGVALPALTGPATVGVSIASPAQAPVPLGVRLGVRL